jgi:hypothetical protein
MESNYKKVGHALSKEGIVNPNTRGMGSQLKKMLGETDGSSLNMMDDTMNTVETESNVQGSDSQMINNQITAMKTGGVKGGFYKKGTDHDGDGDIDSEDYMESRNQAIKRNS